jgi:hypothetical protein
VTDDLRTPIDLNARRRPEPPFCADPQELDSLSAELLDVVGEDVPWPVIRMMTVAALRWMHSR